MSNRSTHSAETRTSFLAKLNRIVVVEKLHNVQGFLFFFAASVALSLLIVEFGLLGGILSVAAIVGLPMVYCLVAFPRFGVVVYLVMAYFIMWFFKIGVNFPLGTLMDGMEVLFILSLFISQKKGFKDWSMFQTPVTGAVLLWVCYNFIEVLNPYADSRSAWLYTVRTVAVVMFMYFVFVYYIDTRQFVRFIVKLWLGLALFAALYAFKQQHIGFFPFEEYYLHQPGVEFLLFIGGVWRKFSIFSDPVAFSYNMATASLLCIAMLSGPVNRLERLVLSILIVCYLIAMLYSGTRGAFVLVPVSLVLLGILKFNRYVLLATVIVAAMLFVLINVPTSNNTLYRFQTAFRPSEDASFKLRKMNQKRIQPFIQEHPLGGGLGSTGEWGKRFAPKSMLANFPPDSGYVRVAVELGWFGLLLFCGVMFTFLRQGIVNYFKIRDPELRSYCLGATLVVFALNFGNYPQEALVQYPSNVYFYLSVALITITLRLDRQQSESEHGIS